MRVDAVPGDIVEGASAGILGLQALEPPDRRLWLFDAFSGMPAPGEKDDAAAREIIGGYVGSEANTHRILGRLGVPQDRYQLIAGWLADTLPSFSKPPTPCCTSTPTSMTQ